MMLALGGQGLSCRLLVPEAPENGGSPWEVRGFCYMDKSLV